MKNIVRKVRTKLADISARSRLIKMVYRGPVRKFNRLIKKWSLPEYVELEGNMFYIDRFDTLDLNNGPYGSKLFRDLLIDNIREGDIALNIGANIGYYTVLMAKKAGESGKVYAFEPDHENFNILRKNIACNNCLNIEPVKKAVSDKDGKAKLYLDEYNQGDHRIYDSGDNRKFIEIETISIDNFFKKNQKIDFILLDAQGSEFSILKGMKNIINKNSNIKIITEFSPYHLRKSGCSPEDYLNLIRKLGFNIFDIDEKRMKIERKNVKDLIKEYDLQGEKATDLFLTRKSNVSF